MAESRPTPHEPSFRIWIRRIEPPAGPLAIRYEMTDGKGILRQNRPGVVLDPPARPQGIETGLSAAQVRSARFLHVWGKGAFRQGYLLVRLTDAEIARLPDEEWIELVPAREAGQSWLSVPAILPARPRVAVRRGGADLPTVVPADRVLPSIPSTTHGGSTPVERRVRRARGEAPLTAAPSRPPAPGTPAPAAQTAPRPAVSTTANAGNTRSGADGASSVAVVRRPPMNRPAPSPAPELLRPPSAPPALAAAPAPEPPRPSPGLSALSSGASAPPTARILQPSPPPPSVRALQPAPPPPPVPRLPHPDELDGDFPEFDSEEFDPEEGGEFLVPVGEADDEDGNDAADVLHFGLHVGGPAVSAGPAVRARAEPGPESIPRAAGSVDGYEDLSGLIEQSASARDEREAPDVGDVGEAFVFDEMEHATAPAPSPSPQRPAPEVMADGEFEDDGPEFGDEAAIRSLEGELHAARERVRRLEAALAALRGESAVLR